MKTLLGLSAAEIVERPTDPRGFTQAVHDEPRPGLHRLAALGASGLTLKCGETRVHIPLAELWKLGEQHEPALLPPMQKVKHA